MSATKPNAMTDRSIDQFLPYLLSRASHLVSRRFYALLKRHGMPIREWRVLATLYDGEGVPLGELAEICLIEQSTATRLIDRMAVRRLVEKRIDEKDRRRTFVHIAPAGGAAVEGLMVQAREIDNSIVAGFDTGRRARLKEELEALISAMEAEGPGNDA